MQYLGLPMLWRLALLAWMSGAGASEAQQLYLHETSYEDAVQLTDPTREDFEGIDTGLAQPILRLNGLEVGGLLKGQSAVERAGIGHDRHLVLQERHPDTPLELDSSRAAPLVAVARSGQLGSQALFGLGPEPYPGRNSVGTGIVTLLFDAPQCLVGFRTYLEARRSSTLLRDDPEGNLNLIFWKKDGTVIGEFIRAVDHRLVETAYTQSSGGGPEIMAVTFQNLDPAGIGIDDLIFSPLCPVLVG